MYNFEIFFIYFFTSILRLKAEIGQTLEMPELLGKTSYFTVCPGNPNCD